MNSNKFEIKSKGVESLLGNPEKTLVRLGIPTSISLIMTVVYQITDIIWISGLGVDALAALGFLMPFIFFINAIASGLATGGGTKISQYIGSQDKGLADRVTVHTLFFTIVISVPVIMLFLIFIKPLLLFMGAGRLMNTAFNLGLLYIPAIFFWVFNQAASSILQAEGDARRVLIGSLLAIVLNIILDPIFIYYFEFGIYGTAIASIFSAAAQFSLLVFWLFFKKNTFVTCSLKGFRLDRRLSLAIVKLGLPVSLSQISSSFLVFIITTIVAIKAGTDGVAVYSTGLRFGNYVLLPTYGISLALNTVAAAAMGTGSYEKLKISYYFTLKISFVITLALAVVTYFFAGQISSLLTWSKESSRIAADLTVFLKIYAWYFPAISIWMTSINFFVGIGYSIFDFLFNFLKHILYTIPLTYLFAVILNRGLPSIWIIIVIGMWIHSILAFILLRSFLRRYRKTGSFGSEKASFALD